MKNVLKVNKFNKNVKEWAFQKSLSGKHEMLKGGDLESVDEWVKFRD